MVVDRFGVRPTTNAADFREQTRAAKFFWLDIFGGNDVTRAELLDGLGFDAVDINWAVRFGQAGRLYIGRNKLRAVTWLADDAGNLCEIHVLSSPQCILTIWQGDAAALDEIRQQFGERADGFEKSHFAAAGLLLQLLVGTLDHAIRNLDRSLDHLRIGLDKDPHSADMASIWRRLQKLQTLIASFNRYSSAVRSAIVGIETVTGMDPQGAEELNEYADQVEDVEHQIYERRRWMSDIMHDNAMAIAQRQAEQINRLTLVSLIFLPVTALSGFFGMNFNWMINHIDGPAAFVGLGITLPIVSVIVSIGYFRHRGLIHFKSRARDEPPTASARGIEEWMTRQGLRENAPPDSETAAPLPPKPASRASA
jgi:Mg2+ and Co2+ transporter CorA